MEGYYGGRNVSSVKEWDIAPLEKRLVGWKWIFTVKYKVNGSIERYKATLVMKGFTQIYRIDYQENFTLIAKMNAIRILLSCTALLD